MVCQSDAGGLDCGLCHITDEELRTKLKVEVPEKAEEIEDMKFGEIQEYVSAFYCSFLDFWLMLR